MDADKVRELASRGEGPTLDYKRDDYDWDDKAKSNAELAKDIMAIANGLQRGAEPGYILVGVDNEGDILGIATKHVDDANLQQKVSSQLNRTPTFLYRSVDVGGLSVGVYEIKPGGRPFFPLKTVGSLQKHIAMHRGGGTGATVASPDVIMGWGREDNAEEHELRLHQVQAAPVGRKLHDGHRKLILQYGGGPIGLFIDGSSVANTVYAGNSNAIFRVLSVAPGAHVVGPSANDDPLPWFYDGHAGTCASQELVGCIDAHPSIEDVCYCVPTTCLGVGAMVISELQ